MHIVFLHGSFTYPGSYSRNRNSTRCEGTEKPLKAAVRRSVVVIIMLVWRTRRCRRPPRVVATVVIARAPSNRCAGTARAAIHVFSSRRDVDPCRRRTESHMCPGGRPPPRHFACRATTPPPPPPCPLTVAVTGAVRRRRRWWYMMTRARADICSRVRGTYIRVHKHTCAHNAVLIELVRYRDGYRGGGKRKRNQIPLVLTVGGGMWWASCETVATAEGKTKAAAPGRRERIPRMCARAIEKAWAKT